MDAELEKFVVEVEHLKDFGPGYILSTLFNVISSITNKLYFQQTYKHKSCISVKTYCLTFLSNLYSIISK